MVERTEILGTDTSGDLLRSLYSVRTITQYLRVREKMATRQKNKGGKDEAVHVT